MISVIMPTYNTEKFIDRSIISVLNQTYENWELCIVDDNSTDNTVNIIRKYINQDKRIKLKENNKNLGCGISRRKAIEMAQGDYIFFLDSDDWIDNNTFNDLLNISITTESDVVICGVYNYYNEKYTGQSIAEKPHILNGIELYKQFVNGVYIMPYNCNKLFKKSVIDSYQYSDLRFCEDTLTCAHWLLFANQAFIINRSYYHYCQRDNSNSNTNNDRLTKSFCTIKCLFDHIEICEKYNLKQEKQLLLREAYERLCFCIQMFPIDSEEYNFCNTIRNKYYVRKNN